MRFSSHSSDDDDLERLSQAAHYLLTLDDETDEANNPDDALRWAADDSRNLRAFRRVHALRGWLCGLNRTQKSALAKELLPETMHRSLRTRPTSWRWVGSVAAALLIVALGLAFLLHGYAPATHPTVRAYATARGAEHKISLPDGTHIVLAAHSRLRVAYLPHRRKVTLENGEAYFSVHHDASRPFVVHVGNLEVTDLGTVFDVNRTPGQVTISVAHGRVQVNQTHPPAKTATGRGKPVTPAKTSVQVGAGHQITAFATSGSLRVVPIANQSIAAWRHGRLRFNDARLSTVVEILNRYSHRHITLATPQLGNRRFTGTIFIHNMHDWLHAACAVFQLREHYTPDGGVVLYAAPKHTWGPQR